MPKSVIWIIERIFQCNSAWALVFYLGLSFYISYRGEPHFLCQGHPSLVQDITLSCLMWHGSPRSSSLWQVGECGDYLSILLGIVPPVEISCLHSISAHLMRCGVLTSHSASIALEQAFSHLHFPTWALGPLSPFITSWTSYILVVGLPIPGSGIRISLPISLF